jgi:O-antigen ligase
LLWLVRPIFNDTAAAQFGPFNYRSNGAQYLNMIWPLAIAFWWSLYRHSRAKVGQGKEFLLLPFCGLMVAAPIIASSRGGVVVAIAEVFAVIGIFAYAYRENAWKAATAAGVLIAIVTLGAWIERDTLLARINENTLNTMSGRTEIYRNARRIAADFPIWGTGPGTFAAVYQVYREDPNQLWYAQAHNDYLQTLITFGRVGSSIIFLAGLLICTYWFTNRGIPTSSLFVSFVWVGLGGMLLHAKFDFPMQIYSILLIVVTLCAILTSVVRR